MNPAAHVSAAPAVATRALPYGLSFDITGSF
jgi:hypothetical protein